MPNDRIWCPDGENSLIELAGYPGLDTQTSPRASRVTPAGVGTAKEVR